MVNVVDAFTKAFGRAPTEKEVGDMMRLKVEQDKRRMEQKKQAVAADVKLPTPKIYTKPRKPRTKKVEQVYPNKMSARAHMINRMLIIQVMPDDIAFGLGMSQAFVNAEIDKWKLPREPRTGSKPFGLK